MKMVSGVNISIGGVLGWHICSGPKENRKQLSFLSKLSELPSYPKRAPEALAKFMPKSRIEIWRFESGE